MAIAKAFFTFVETLKKRWNKQREVVDVQRRKEKKKRLDSRKAGVSAHHHTQVSQLTVLLQLFARRLRIARKKLPTHVRLMRHLGTAGMSSDETDTDVGPDTGPRFKIFVKEWRHPQVRELLKAMDTLYVISRRTQRQGNLPNPRIVTNITKSIRQPVTHLPRNAYNPVWLAHPDNYVAGDLEPDADYDFTLDPDIQR